MIATSAHGSPIRPAEVPRGVRTDESKRASLISVGQSAEGARDNLASPIGRDVFEAIAIEDIIAELEPHRRGRPYVETPHPPEATPQLDPFCFCQSCRTALIALLEHNLKVGAR